MAHGSEPRPANVTPEAISACADVLEALSGDRGLLAAVDPATRRRLMTAAGRVSRPERDEQRGLRKALRRRDRVEQREADEAVRRRAAIRALRELPVYPTPALPAAEPEGPGRELREARKCYVCKASFRTLHFFYDQLCPPCGDFNHAKRIQ